MGECLSRYCVLDPGPNILYIFHGGCSAVWEIRGPAKKHSSKLWQLELHCHLRVRIEPVILGLIRTPAVQTYSAALYQISMQLDNPWLSYGDVTISNLGTVRHPGLHSK